MAAEESLAEKKKDIDDLEEQTVKLKAARDALQIQWDQTNTKYEKLRNLWNKQSFVFLSFESRRIRS